MCSISAATFKLQTLQTLYYLLYYLLVTTVYLLLTIVYLLFTIVYLLFNQLSDYRKYA